MSHDTILITGGLGFIGSHVAIKFHDLGYTVCVVDNLSRPTPNLNRANTQDYNRLFFQELYPSIQIYIRDIRDQQKLKEIFRAVSPTIVIHAAGQTSAIGSISDPGNDFENNVVGLFNTLECTRQCIAPNTATFVYFSTNKVYGTIPNQTPLHESETRYILEDPQFQGISENTSIDQSMHSPYGISKLAGDLYVQEYGKTYNINTAIFRLSCIYGPRQFGFEEQGWISHFIISTLLNHPITIFGDGKQVRDVLYIDDLLEIVIKFIKKTQSTNIIEGKAPKSNHVFNVGGGIKNSISLLELMALIKAKTGKTSNLVMQDWRPADQKYYVTDISKIGKILLWAPETSPVTGIEKVIQWTQDHLDLFQITKGPLQ